MSVRKACNQINNAKRKAEMGLYLNPHMPFSYHNIQHFVYIATRGIGKSVVSVETAIILKRKYGYENVKCFYFRLKDDSIKAMLANHAEKAVDPYLIQKYDLLITCKNNIIYDHGKPLIEFYALVSAGSKGKGVNLYDCNFFKRTDENGKRIKTFIVTIWDEFLMADGVEKRSIGDPVSQYKIYMEAVLRDCERLDYDAVKCFYLANNVSECASITAPLFNYIPDPSNHNIVKLTRRHCIFWNCPVTQAYTEKRKKSYMSDLIDFLNDPNYTAALQKDLTLIKPKKTQIYRVTYLLKFDNIDPNKWFCVYDGKYIRQYRKETVSRDIVVPMKRYIDGIYSPEKILEVFERYETRSYKYCDLMSQSLFQAQLKLLKSK